MGKRKRSLSSKQEEYILNNYKTKTFGLIAKELNAKESAVRWLAKKNNLKTPSNAKRAYKKMSWTTPKLIEEAKKQSGYLTYTEISAHLRKKGFEVPSSKSHFNDTMLRNGIRSFKMHYTGETKRRRLFLDPENIERETVIIVDEEIYKWLWHHKLVDLTGGPLLAAIELAKFKTSVNKKIAHYRK